MPAAPRPHERRTRSSKRALYTIGYEGKTVDRLVASLVADAIAVLVDVRQLPLSRKKGFSKNSLKKELAAAGIDYVHFRELGSPRDARRRLHDDGDYEAFFRAYAQHLEAHADALNKLSGLFSRAPVCLMCYEAEAEKCHRSVLAARLERATEAVVVVHR